MAARRLATVRELPTGTSSRGAAKRGKRPNTVEATSGRLADPRKLEQIIDEMAGKHLECRSQRHIFERWHHKRGDGDGFESTASCKRGCGAVVTQIIDSQGYLVNRKMDYADKDYLLTGFGRATQATNALMRVTNIRRNIR